MMPRFIVVSPLTALAVLAGGTAHAVNLDSYAPNATGHGFSYGTNTRAAITDTKSEGDSVYIYYQRQGQSTQRLENFSGSGTTVQTGAGATVRTLQACVNLTAAPDQCGSWA